MWIARAKSCASLSTFGRVGDWFAISGISRGFYKIMSSVSLGASDRYRHFINFSLLPRFDSTC